MNLWMQTLDDQRLFPDIFEKRVKMIFDYVGAGSRFRENVMRDDLTHHASRFTLVGTLLQYGLDNRFAISAEALFSK